MQKNNPTLLNAWCSYDWANSVYNLIVTTAIFPIYYSSSTRSAFGGDTVSFLGYSISNTVLYTYAISFSFLLIVLSSPILSNIADTSGKKKLFMKLFTYTGSTACIGLYFFTGKNIEYGITCAILASIGYAGSLVFYNGFLPEIATPDRMDKLSAKGFSLGYSGSIILLLINLAMILNYKAMGFETAMSATRFGFILVGLWWLSFSQIAFYYLKEIPQTTKRQSTVLKESIAGIKKVMLTIGNYPTMVKFLFSFFFYSMGVQTVMLLAPLFGETEIGLASNEMIYLVLVLQVLAIGGAFLFAFIAKRAGNKIAIGGSLLIWIVICISGYFLQNKVSFYILGGLLGFVMGGIQSLSRSTYSKLIPEESQDTASFFSFYDITEKLAIVLGSFSYGLINQLTGSMRNSMISMSLFFVIGLIILQTLKFNTNKNGV